MDQPAASIAFLADESCDFAAVRALRAAGYDVLPISELHRKSIDEDVIKLAADTGRILLTEDKDFGWLAYVRQVGNAGVILIRFPATARRDLGASVVKLAEELGTRLIGAFVVLRPGLARISRDSSATS